MKRTFASIMLLVTVILMDLLGGAEIDLFAPSFPELQAEFGLSPFWVETLLSVNFAGFFLSLLFVGGLADQYGHKPIILLGLAIFIIGSIFCVLASSYSIILIGRFLQGLGVAAPATLCFIIIADAYPLKQQQYFMGVLNGFMNVAVAGAPVIGSYITMYFHWRGNFMALLLFALPVLIMTIFFIPKYKTPEDKEPLSLSGYLPIFKSKPLMLLIINAIFMCAPYWIFLGMSPILYMEDLGVSLAHFGYYQGAWALVFALGSIFFGLMISKFSAKNLLYISAWVWTLGLGLIALASFLDICNPLIIALSLIPLGIGGIIPNIILYPIALNFMPQAKGRISAVIKGGLLISTGIGLELAGYFYQQSFQNIGIIISVVVLVAVISLFFVIKNREIMKFSRE